MSTPTIITASDLERLIARGAVAHVWNVLAEPYFTGEMIPGSRWVPVDRVARETIERGIAKDAAIVVYCSGPTCPNSGDAARKLATIGFTNVSQFEGGLAAWADAGLPIERPRAAAASR